MSLSELYLRDENFKIIAVIDDAKSVIWTERYDECGDFEIYIRADSEVAKRPLNNLRKYVTHNDSTMVGIIEKFSIESTEEGEKSVILSGKSMVGVLGYRVITNTEDFQNASLDSVVTTLITDNIISSSIEARNIEIFGGVTFLASTSSVPKISGNYFGENLYECIAKLCRAHNYGIRAIPVYADKSIYELDEIIIQFYKGVDRTWHSWSDLPVVFSQENDNLADYTLEESVTDQVSTALVSNSGDTPSKLTTVFTDQINFDGIRRREIYAKYTKTTSASYLPTALSIYGLKEISKHKYFGEVTANISDTQTYEYGTHYNLGDMVIVRFDSTTTIEARVVEITSCLDSTGYHVMPKLKY